MEFERQFYLDYPYNQEYEHLPISSSRLMRNLAEKMRRDKLNMYISELSSLVPIVAMATKRMDKTSVLRLSANFLRIHLSLKQNNKKVEKAKLVPDGLESNLSSTLLEALEGFMLIVTSSGKIVYVSDSVEKLLGHSQLDLMGQSLYTICHNGDHELLRHHLQPATAADEKATASAPAASESDKLDYVPRSPSFFGGNPEDALSGLASGERRSFYVRLAERSMARGDPARHVTVHLIGLLRPPSSKKENKGTTTKGKKECSSTTSSDEYMLVCVARPFRNKGITELSLMEAVQDEYVTRHLPDGRIIYSDHRIAFVAGYLTEEVMGLSAFHFIHQDDLPWATVANRQMFSSVEGQGYSVYRLRSKTGTLIHLKTRGYLEFNKTTQKVETFVCINTLLSPEDGEKELEKERDRITPFITFQQVTTTTPSTNGNCSVGGSLTSSPGNATNALLSSHQSSSNIPIQTKVTSSTITLISRSDQKHKMGISTTTTATTTTAHHSPPIVEIVELPSDDHQSPIDLLSSSPNSVHVNGDSTSSIHQLEQVMMPSISSPPALTSDPNMGVDTNLDQIAQEVLSLSPPMLTSTSRLGDNVIVCGTQGGDLLPRLKRSLAEVDDLVVTSSAKRSIVPAAFISTYSTLHHMSPHLNNKWRTEKTSTIIYDQHNNNG
ncbi:unnamed protein product [Allacma fusca]|uniref:Methoprene-tolerant protein n=1 Tax=Allacma fusca TaxID=39272 RepID=A0A8J2P153_9HEXA|nr:unnamed protein product [Allacma fusca]